ncbi:MAG: hypothetical protein A3E85_02405 [Gammaproteobacteria bacterium RIFCSPHIGHO2_12_FULL_45_12]|nr:MAG: hypothetical protein A3E85_02405 [Gammaproteobacteria bacterium RIFCSPHIGHO2_12_FULL_45_12]
MARVLISATLSRIFIIGYLFETWGRISYSTISWPINQYALTISTSMVCRKNIDDINSQASKFFCLFSGFTKGMAEVKSIMIDDKLRICNIILSLPNGMSNKLTSHIQLDGVLCEVLFHEKDDILFINASQHFEKGKRQNQLLPEHIEKIVSTYQFRKEEDRYSKRVSIEDIRDKHDYNLNISRYISTAEPEKEIDLQAVHAELLELEQKIDVAFNKHNAFLKELG